MSRVSIRPSGSKTPSGGRTPMSPSENIWTTAREPFMAAGAWKAWTDSRSARATTATDCIFVDLRGGRERGTVRKRWGEMLLGRTHVGVARTRRAAVERASGRGIAWAVRVGMCTSGWCTARHSPASPSGGAARARSNYRARAWVRSLGFGIDWPPPARD
eukprot:7380367-Prymnesium_polylepis.2